MINNFERIRNKLHKSIDTYGLDAEKTRKISQRYNELVNSYYQEEKQYHQNSIMYQAYLKSIKHLKKITRDFIKFPTIKEWNYYAKQNNLLNSESLKYITGKTWHDLRNKILSALEQ